MMLSPDEWGGVHGSGVVSVVSTEVLGVGYARPPHASSVGSAVSAGANSAADLNSDAISARSAPGSAATQTLPGRTGTNRPPANFASHDFCCDRSDP